VSDKLSKAKFKDAMKILVAPCAYKGTITASALATAISAGIKSQDPAGLIQIELAPVADGGDDTLACLKLAAGGDLIYETVLGPTSKPVSAAYLVSGETACIELAQASGIAHLQAHELAPLTAHTYGTGELIAHAIGGGARNIVITLGGSASTDGGTAILAALGAKLLDKHGNSTIFGGGSLIDIEYIDLALLQEKTRGVTFTIATDVVSPLLSTEGAAAVFAPQKGATATEVILLEQGLAHFANLLEAKMQSLPSLSPQTSLRYTPGAGAAGGAGFGLATALSAGFVSGFHWLAERIDLMVKLHWCDLVVVAEGCLDGQSLSGKAVGELVQLAAQAGKDVIALPAVTTLSAGEQSKLFNAVYCTAGQPFCAGGEASIESVIEAAKLISGVSSRS